MYSVCVCVCVLSSPLRVELPQGHPARATVWQIQNKLYAKAAAPLVPGLRRFPERQMRRPALNCVAPCTEQGHRVGMEIQVPSGPCATLNSGLHVDSFLRGGGKSGSGGPDNGVNLPIESCWGHLVLYYSCLSCCDWSTFTYHGRHSFCSSRWNSGAHFSTTWWHVSTTQWEQVNVNAVVKSSSDVINVLVLVVTKSLFK